MKAIEENLTQNQENFLHRNSSRLIIEDGRKYYFLPYWFEDMGDGKYHMHHLDRLPEELIQEIKRFRGLTPTGMKDIEPT